MGKHKSQDLRVPFPNILTKVSTQEQTEEVKILEDIYQFLLDLVSGAVEKDDTFGS